MDTQALWEAYFVPLIAAVKAGSAEGGISGIKNAANETINPSTEEQSVIIANLLKTLPIVYGEPYLSPQDFSVAFSTGTKLIASGAPFDVDDTSNYVASVVVKNAAGIITKYYNGYNGISIVATSNEITLNGSIGLPFVSTDQSYRVAVLGQEKAYDVISDTEKVTEQSPLSGRYVQDSIIDVAYASLGPTGINYYPSATGMLMDGFKDMSLSGYIIEGDAVTDTLEVQVSNDEDTADATSWVTIYGYSPGTNTVVNIVTTGGVAGTYPFLLHFDNLNFSNVRIKLTTTDATYTAVAKMRRKAL